MDNNEKITELMNKASELNKNLQSDLTSLNAKRKTVMKKYSKNKDLSKIEKIRNDLNI